MIGLWVRYRWWVGGLGFAVALLVVGVWLAWPDDRPAAEPPRARQYLDYTACLLTDGQGIVTGPAKSMWAGMQSASLATRVKVQYLAVVGEQRVDNAVPFARSLAQGRCSLVFAAGPLASDAVRAVAAEYPGVAFFVSAGPAAAGVVAVLDAALPEGLSADVDGRIRSVVAASPSIR
jgi:hypothetical protein